MSQSALNSDENWGHSEHWAPECGTGRSMFNLIFCPPPNEGCSCPCALLGASIHGLHDTAAPTHAQFCTLMMMMATAPLLTV